MEFLKWLRGQWDRVTSGALAAGGLLALILGWVGSSGSPYPAGQIPYVISGGLIGIFLLGAAGTLWLSADLRDDWRKLDRVEEELHALRSEQPTVVDTITNDPITNDPITNGTATNHRRRATSRSSN